MGSIDDVAALRAGSLIGARRLDLGGLGLRTCPPEILDLADTLEVLDLSGNHLAGLPAEIATLTKLRVLFLSGNPLDRLPPALGACPSLGQIGARGCGLREVPADALPQSLRWLTLTDNALERLPDALGERPRLQKLMLAGNRLSALPETLADAQNLELLRISANAFDALPPWLFGLPRLAWLAFAGNPMGPPVQADRTAVVTWMDLHIEALLGEGASGRIYQARWRAPGDAEARPVAVKLFKGAMTSDGLPGCEMTACLAAGNHPHLAGALARVAGHPEGRDGLLMPLLPATWRPLAGPPSLESCSRDFYPPDLRLTLDVALRIAGGIAAAGAHLHERRLLHGDLYAHNVLWDGAAGDAVLSDFGAASFLAPDTADAARLDVRAWGLLLGELLDLCDDAPARGSPLRHLEAACTQAPAARPSLAEVLRALAQMQ